MKSMFYIKIDNDENNIRGTIYMIKEVNERRELVSSILEKYSGMVYKLAYSRMKNTYDAEDILQEVLMKYMKLHSEFIDENHEKAWFIRVTINCSKNLLTSAWFRKTTALEDNVTIDIKENSEVYKYVLQLPKKYRTVIHLFYYEDMSTFEISKALEVKESTIRSQLHRARNLLKDTVKGVEL